MTELSTADQPEIDIREILKQRHQIAIIWSPEDVQEIRPDLTDSQAWEVLQACERCHDCEMGITWLALEYMADSLFPISENK